MAIDLRMRRVSWLAFFAAASGLPLLAAPPATPKGAGAQPQKSGPTAQEVLRDYQPAQKDVQIDRPERAEIAKCTIQPEKFNGKTGWVVRDSGGQILRNFMDTNNDNVVDQWSYYKDGVEVYREIDSNFNSKADQFRWLNTAGTRWGIDVNEDGKIDGWKVISAEEVTAELVAALRDRDKLRFERLLLTPKELKALGISAAKGELLQKKIEGAVSGFGKLAGQQKIIGPETKWVSFGGHQPGLVPAETEESTADVVVYENVMAMVETDSKATPINVGTMVRVKDTWRLIDLPEVSENTADGSERKPFFFAMPRLDRNETQTGAKPNEKMSELMNELQKLGEITPASTPKQHERREEIFKQLTEEADTPELRGQWYRQWADTLSAAVQTGGYDVGIEKLKTLHETLAADNKDEELVAYVQYRWMQADHGHQLAQPNPPFQKIQDKWIEDLEKFVENRKKFPDSADAIMELAIAQEFGGDEEKALKWYDTLAREYPNSPMHRKAVGAKTRLTCVGKSIPLHGKLANGSGSFDIAALKGKVVLVQYWATWCEPCKADMPLLKELRTKFKEFEVVGVCLDNEKKDMLDFLKHDDPRWPQLFEEGGQDNRFANELGIQNLPTMILIDKQGKVVNRNIGTRELESELKKLLK